MTSKTYFAAVDIDCDGASTAIVRLHEDVTVGPDGSMPVDVWTRVFDGSNYHGPSEWFVVASEDVYRAEHQGMTWWGTEPSFSDHGGYDYMSVKGNIFR